MSLTKTQKNATTESLFQAKRFEDIEMKISEAAMSHVISRLTDLYDDPIVATVREVISNAIDTTLRVKKENQQPVKVLMPTELRDTFTVTDYGEGMSIEDIRNIYSKYGASTKVLDMTQIGAYGLGAKAPLSYCSSFVVTSTKDGITTVVNVSKTEVANTMNIISSKETGLPNGTTIQIPVRESDIYAFQKAGATYETWALDVPVEIEPHFSSEKSNFNKYTTIPITFDGDVYELDVYVNRLSKDIIPDLIKANSQNYRGEIGYSLIMSGFNYASRNPALIAINLIPGLIDFASSRDYITKNSRYENLVSQIDEKLWSVLGAKVQEEINDGTIDLKQVFAYTIGSNSYKTIGTVNKLKLKDKEGHPISEVKTKLLTEINQDFPVVFKKEAGYSSTNNFYVYLLEAGVERVELKSTNGVGLVDELTQPAPKFPNVGFAMNDKVTQRVVITDVDTKDFPRVAKRSTTYIKRISNEVIHLNRDEYVFFPTSLSKKQAEKAISVWGTLSNYTFITYDEYIAKTAAQRTKRSTTGTSAPRRVRNNLAYGNLLRLAPDARWFSQAQSLSGQAIQNGNELSPEEFDAKDVCSVLVLVDKGRLDISSVNRIICEIYEYKEEGKNVLLVIKRKNTVRVKDFPTVKNFDKVITLTEPDVPDEVRALKQFKVATAEAKLTLKAMSSDAFNMFKAKNQAVFSIFSALYYEDDTLVGAFLKKIYPSGTYRGQNSDIRTYGLDVSFSEDTPEDKYFAQLYRNLEIIAKENKRLSWETYLFSNLLAEKVAGSKRANDLNTFAELEFIRSYFDENLKNK